MKQTIHRLKQGEKKNNYTKSKKKKNFCGKNIIQKFTNFKRGWILRIK